MPQVASDPTIHAHSPHLPRPTPPRTAIRPGALAVREPDRRRLAAHRTTGARTNRQQDRGGGRHSKAPAKTNDSNTPAANDAAPAAESDDDAPVAKPDNDKPACDTKAAADTKLVESVITGDKFQIRERRQDRPTDKRPTSRPLPRHQSSRKRRTLPTQSPSRRRRRQFWRSCLIRATKTVDRNRSRLPQ